MSTDAHAQVDVLFGVFRPLGALLCAGVAAPPASAASAAAAPRTLCAKRAAQVTDPGAGCNVGYSGYSYGA